MILNESNNFFQEMFKLIKIVYVHSKCLFNQIGGLVFLNISQFPFSNPSARNQKPRLIRRRGFLLGNPLYLVSEIQKFRSGAQAGGFGAYYGHMPGSQEKFIQKCLFATRFSNQYFQTFQLK